MRNVKKLSNIIMVLGIVIFVYGSAHASSAGDTVGVLLTVDPKFTLTISEDTVDMGTVFEGSSGVGGVTLYCSTNQGNPWRVDIRTTLLTGITTGKILNFMNFKFRTYPLPDYNGVDSAGTFVTTDFVIRGFDLPAYTAAVSEYSDTDVRVGVVFVLDVPWSQPADTYAATVTCTMTE